MIRRVKVLGSSESGWKPCDATEDDLTVSPRGNSGVWAELRCANQISDGGKVLVNWIMAMIGRKVEDEGLLVDRSACDP